MKTQTVPSLRERLDSPSANPFRHVPPLDGIRGVGIILVMFGHFSAGLSDYLKTRLFGVSLTIDLFFILSGFLITSLLLEEWSRKGTISMRNFYVRRGLRLLPALFVLLGVMVLIALFTDLLPAKLTIIEAVAAALYVYPVVLILRPDQVFLIHLWTLSIEEWFYFCWPALLAYVGLRKGTTRRLQLVVVSLIAFVVLCGVLRVFVVPSPLTRPFLLFRPDSLFYGALLAIFIRKLPDWRTALFDRIAAVVGPLSIIGFIYFDLFAIYPRGAGSTDLEFHDEAFASWNYQLGIMCATVMIFHVSTRQHSVWARIFSWRPWVEIGLLSYGLYLWHQPIFLLFNDHWYRYHRDTMGWGVFAVLMGLVSLAVALASRYIVEKPALKMKTRFEVVHFENKR